MDKIIILWVSVTIVVIMELQVYSHLLQVISTLINEPVQCIESINFDLPQYVWFSRSFCNNKLYGCWNRQIKKYLVYFLLNPK